MAASYILTRTYILNLLFGLGYAMTITVDPSDIQETIISPATIKCDPDDVGGAVQNIKALTLMKDSTEPIAFVSACGSPNCVYRHSSEIQAAGTFGGTVAQTQLTVIIQNPTPKFSGVYSCILHYMDTSGLLKEDTSEKKMTVKAYTATDLKPDVENITSRVKDLETFSNPECVSAFAMTAKSELSLTKDSTLVLPDSMMTKGKGYNKDTGVFTAPCNGVYAFHLTASIGFKSCGSGLHRFRDQCYAPVNVKKTYGNARQHCLTEFKGHIAAPRDVEENDFIARIRPENINIIGINDYDEEGVHVREDGEDLEWFNWADGEPNDLLNQDFVHMLENKLWNDFSESDTLKFVCATVKQVADFQFKINNNDWFRVQASRNKDGSASSATYLNKDDTVKITLTKADGTKLVGNSYNVYSGHLVTRLE